MKVFMITALISVFGITAFAQVNPIDYLDAQEHLVRGNHLASLKNYTEAIKYYTKAINLVPNYGEAYFQRGVSFDALYKWESAVADLTRAINLSPDEPAPYVYRSHAYMQLGKITLARADTKKFFEIKAARLPGDIKRLLDDIGKYMRAKNYDEVLKISNEIIYLDPNNSDAYYYRAKAYNNLGKTDNALADLNKSLQIKQSGAYLLRAEIYSSRNFGIGIY